MPHGHLPSLSFLPSTSSPSPCPRRPPTCVTSMWIPAPTKADFRLSAPLCPALHRHTDSLSSWLCLSYLYPKIHMCRPTPSLAAPACSSGKPQNHPFFHPPRATSSSLKPVCGNWGAGVGKWVPGRLAEALEGRGQLAGERWPRGAPGSSEGHTGTGRSAHRI